MAVIKGILFDKDGTLVDFNATWLAIGDMMALQAAGGDRQRADAMLADAGYDFAAGKFRADSVFAAGTNADVVALWYPDVERRERDRMVIDFDAFTAELGPQNAWRCPAARKRSPGCMPPATGSPSPPTIRPAARKRRC